MFEGGGINRLAVERVDLNALDRRSMDFHTLPNSASGSSRRNPASAFVKPRPA